MKIKTRFFLIFICMLTLCACSKKPVGSSTDLSIEYTGRYYYSESRDCNIIFIEGNGPVIIDGENEKSIFQKLNTGDLIAIECDVILESYPGYTTITSLELKEKGSIENIDKDELNELQKLGW